VQLYCSSIFLNVDNNPNLFKSNFQEKTETKVKDSELNIVDNVKRQLFATENDNNISKISHVNDSKSEEKIEVINEENSHKNKENENPSFKKNLKRKSKETEKKGKKTKKLDKLIYK